MNFEVKLITDRKDLNALDVPQDIPAVVTVGTPGSAPDYVLQIALIQDMLRKYEELRSGT